MGGFVPSDNASSYGYTPCDEFELHPYAPELIPHSQLLP